MEIYRLGQEDTYSDWNSVCQEWGGFKNTLAENIVNFMFDERADLLRPDRWEYYEPIRTPVDEYSKDIIKNSLCIPGAMVLLKRIQRPKYTAMICNKTKTFIRKNLRSQFGQRASSVYQSTIHITYSKNTKVSIDDKIDVLKKLSFLFKTDFGYLEDCETEEVLYDLFKTHQDEAIGVDKKYRVLTRKLFDWMGDYYSSKSEAVVSCFYGPMEESFQPHVRQMLKILSLLIRHYYPSLYCAVLFRHAGLLPLSQIYRLIIDRCSSDVVLKSIEFFISFSDPISLYESVGYKATQVEIPEIWDKPFYTLEPPVPNSSPMLLFL